MPTVDLPGIRSIRTDSALHAPGDRSSARLGHLRVLHAGVRLELVRRDDRARVNLDHRALDRELVALLLEEAGGVHQLALVDLVLALRRVEQRERRQRVAVAALPIGVLASKSGSGGAAPASPRLAAGEGAAIDGAGLARPPVATNAAEAAAGAPPLDAASACGFAGTGVGDPPPGPRGLHVVRVLRCASSTTSRRCLSRLASRHSRRRPSSAGPPRRRSRERWPRRTRPNENCVRDQ